MFLLSYIFFRITHMLSPWLKKEIMHEDVFFIFPFDVSAFSILSPEEHGIWDEEAPALEP